MTCLLRRLCIGTDRFPFQENASDHDVVAHDELAVDQWLEWLECNVLPAVACLLGRRRRLLGHGIGEQSSVHCGIPLWSYEVGPTPGKVLSFFAGDRRIRAAGPRPSAECSGK